jgi:hypothetical protein
MSLTLIPSVAASLANLVYTAEDGTFHKREFIPFAKQWDFGDNAEGRVISASSGAAILRKSSGFCVTARGKDMFAGHALVVIRGTSNSFDWATDANVGFSRGASGHMVHMGFQQVFKELLDSGLRQYFMRGERPAKVHCIGHSLGGALATLAAEWLVTHGRAGEAELYTFGSPRVGSLGYSRHAEEKIGLANVHRVFHQQDPVTMVPLWPFFHLPRNSTLRLGGGGSAFIDPKAHRMVKSYAELIKVRSAERKEDSWSALEDNSWVPPTEKALRKWLVSDTVMSFTVNTLNMLGEAISWVFGKIFAALGISMQFVVSAGVTLLDQLAYVLHRGLKAGQELGGIVVQFISKILRLLGRKVEVGMDVSVVFISTVFKALQQRLTREVNNAFNSLRRED